MSEVEFSPPTPAFSYPSEADATAQLIGMALTPSTNNQCKPAKADALATSQFIGFATRSCGEQAQAQYPKFGDVLALSTEEWDAITGGSGGLTPGVYYLSAATAGHITTVVPVAAGSFAVRVGIALSPTRMLVTLDVPVGPHG